MDAARRQQWPGISVGACSADAETQMMKRNGYWDFLCFLYESGRTKRDTEMKKAQTRNVGANIPFSRILDQNQLSMRYAGYDDVRNVCANQGENNSRRK